MTYDELLQLTLEGVFEATVISEDGAVVACNDAFLDLIGGTREQLIGADMIALAPEDSQAEIRETLSTHEPRSYNLHGHRLDGSPLHVEVHGRTFEIDGRHLRVSRIRDLTEREKAQAVLRETESRYRSLFENAADGIMVMNRRGQPQEVNARFCRMLGYSAEEILAMPAEQGIADLRDNPMQLGRLDTESAYVVERTLRTRSGDELQVEVNLTALDEEQVLAVIRDISERRRAEEKETALRQQLHQAQKLESIGRLAGGIAHDFNNLLMIILANAELLGAGRGELETQVGEILRATDRATDLTRQLLLFSRRQVQHPRLLDPNEEVREAEKMLTRLLGEDVEIELDLAVDAGRILADPGQLSQILLNLAVNARDAMPSGGRLTLRTRRRTSPGGEGEPLDHLLLEVTDTGEGISPEVQQYLFEPFFSTKKPGQGTGLGLSTVYGIVTGASGTIEVESRPGEGTTFLIAWPLQEVDLPTGGAPAPHEPRAQREKTYRVLVAEDEPAVARIIERTLESAGHEVVAVGPPEAMLALVEGSTLNFDLLVTDVVMPMMSGPEVARRLQVEHVLFISGYPDAALGERRLEPDPKHLLAKPFTAEALLEAVDRTMAGLPLDPA